MPGGLFWLVPDPARSFPASDQAPHPMTTQYWLVKSEPDTYSWSDLVRDRRTDWTGVRNYAARLHLKAMRAGDTVLGRTLLVSPQGGGDPGTGQGPPVGVALPVTPVVLAAGLWK